MHLKIPVFSLAVALFLAICFSNVFAGGDMFVEEKDGTTTIISGGNISTISGNIISIVYKSGRTRSFRIHNNTQYCDQNKKTASRSDLKIGQEISILWRGKSAGLGLEGNEKADALIVRRGGIPFKLGAGMSVTVDKNLCGK